MCTAERGYMETTTKLSRKIGREVFGEDPAGYHRARPEYPEWIYTTLAAECGLCRKAAVFEIGAGTGKATRRLLELGADPLVAIEPDQRLAEFLRATIAGEALKVLAAPFEDVSLDAGAFDLGVSATAFHWLDEDPALEKIASLLRPGGWWAAVWNEFRDDSLPDTFHEATRELLGALNSPSAGECGIPSFGSDSVARLAALKRTGAFDVTEYRVSHWPLLLDADQTVALYATFSNVSARPDRTVVLSELGRIARNVFGNRVVRNMTTGLYIARRTGRRFASRRLRE
jgi:SAM-dependent methyltransferase